MVLNQWQPPGDHLRLGSPFGRCRTKKWVHDPIGERDRAIHPLSVTLSQRHSATIAPLDAALPYTTAAALSLAAGSVVAFPTTLRLGMPAVLMAAALSRALAAYLTRERLREQADAWLAEARLPNSSVFAWRVEELVGSERKVVGRTLSSFAEEVMRPRRRGAPILNRSQLRPETDLLLAVAQALQDPERVAAPRAIARTKRLITDCGSPLNCSARHDGLHQALKSILADISEPGVAGEHKAQAPLQRRTPPRRTSRARRTRDGADRDGADVGTASPFTLNRGSALTESTSSEAEQWPR